MKNKLPVMLLKGLVMLPTQEVRVDLNNEISRNVISISNIHHDNQLLIVCPKDKLEENPDVSDLPNIGVVGKIKSKSELPGGILRIVIVGLERVRVEEYANNIEDETILEAIVTNIDLPKFNPIEEAAITNKLLESLRSYINISPYISNSLLNSVEGVSDLYKLTDMITLFIPFTIEKKLGYMEEINALKRAESLIIDLSIEIEILALDLKIDENLRMELDSSQKEFILKEKIRQIKKELGEENFKDDEVEEFREKLENLNLNEKTKSKILNEIKKYEFSNAMSPDSSIVRNYLDWILNLPWNRETEDNNDLNDIMKNLDKSHYGLVEVKNRIIEYIAVKLRNKDLKSPIICLVGPPGVGKTSLAKQVATSLNKEFYKLSVGGLNDSSELVGHRRTYLGSNPGKIIQAIKKCDSKNPVILIDEIDKMVKDYKGDPASALLEILDPEQNTIFIDNYIEEPFDLSKVLFILTANALETIPEPLRDRLEIIKLNSYTYFEKIDIAKKHLLPNIYKDHLIKRGDIKISDDVIKYIINNYTKESGVRDLDRKLSTIIRKLVTNFVKNNEDIKTTVKKDDLIDFLGQPKYENGQVKILRPGLVNALAYTPYGGVVMPIEAVIFDGKGNIDFTGLLGESMTESSKVAVSYIRGNKEKFKISDYYFTNKDIHMHALEGAIRKDGPSAGVSIVTSILSLILNKKVDKNIAMSGEISLRGEVLKIGGVREKVIGAYNEGIKKIFLPTSNKSDVDEIPDKIKSKMEFIFVNNYEEIFNQIFN